ncbi:MAG: amino acid ABC transporter permease [Betaproteobacteria bacterium]|nr:MAG: amino acid ABC transporter permease [Betaproteobacteria bacterium]
MNYNWNWKIFWDPVAAGKGVYWEWLVSGLAWTLATGLLAWIIALLIGVVIGVVRTTPLKWLVVLGNAWVELFRNIPLLVQMFLWYFVLPEFLPFGLGTAMKQMDPPWATFLPAVLCLGLYTSARVAEQVKAGIQSLPRGQTLAGTALGLTMTQTYRYVTLPMAFRIVIPPLTSEFMNIIKNTSVALTIGLLELTQRARDMSEYTFQTFEAFTAATVLYIAVTLIVVYGMRRLEKKIQVPGFIGTGGQGAGR